MASGYGDTRVALCLFYFDDIQFDTLGRFEYLALYLLTLVQDRVDLAYVDADVASYIALYDTRYDIFLSAVPLLIQGVALCLTKLL